MTNAPAFNSWLDDFFASYYRHRPVNATFIGVHVHDARLPDFLAQGCESVPLAPDAWIERALDECTGLSKLFYEGIDRLIQEHGRYGWLLRRAADRAAAAVADFAGYLRGGGRRDYIGGYACGAE